MGLGDWIMATAQVREVSERTRRRVAVVDLKGRLCWSPVFENNPRISHVLSPNVERLLNAGNARPYIKNKTPTTWLWKQWDIAPGEIYLTEQERAFGAQFAGSLLVEPNTKVPNGNKAWAFDRWQALVRAMPLRPWLQVGVPGSRVLDGVRFVETGSIREALAVLSAASCFIGTEGAMHHAAAALRIPAVVLWSEFISPAFTGYVSQHNIRKTSGVCGSRQPCASCKVSMGAITVEEVLIAVEQELSK